MCYYVSSKVPAQKYVEYYKAPAAITDIDLFNAPPLYIANGFAHPKLAIIGSKEERFTDLYNWGLIPFWIKNPIDAKKMQNQTLNAKSETIFEKPSFKSSIYKKRILIPVNGFFEYQHVGGDKLPYFIHPKELPYFLLAGIASAWKFEDAILNTFSIITTEANKLMADIHNTKFRQPLTISEENIDNWLDPDLSQNDIIELMQPCDDTQISAYRVNKDLIKMGNVPEVLNGINC